MGLYGEIFKKIFQNHLKHETKSAILAVSGSGPEKKAHPNEPEISGQQHVARFFHTLHAVFGLVSFGRVTGIHARKEAARWPDSTATTAAEPSMWTAAI